MTAADLTIIPTADDTAICVLGIEFAQEVNAVKNVFSQQFAASVVATL